MLIDPNVYITYIILWLTAMNTDAARAPNNNANWATIDIFLFSNGQQHSPPRKYHLRNEDLSWWSLTLNHLAHSHYGSLHSNIELYTTNGTRVISPTELRNGFAYVAVEPPDSFINTGYEKYLIKASRSWEKRHTTVETVKNEKLCDVENIDKTNTSPKSVPAVSNSRVASIKKAGPIMVKKETIQKLSLDQSATGPNAHTKQFSSKTENQALKKNEDTKSPRRLSILKRNNKNSVNSPVLVKKTMEKVMVPKSQDDKVDIKTNIVNSSIPNKSKVSNTPVIQERLVEYNNSVLTFNDLSVIKDNRKINNDESLIAVTEKDIKIVENISDLKKKAIDENKFMTIDLDDVILNRDDGRSSKIFESVVKQEGNQNEPIHQLVYEVVSDALNVSTNGRTTINNNITSAKNSKVKIAKECNEFEQPETIIDISKKRHEKDETSQDINKIRKEKTPNSDLITIISKGNILNLTLNIEVRNNEENQLTVVHKNNSNKNIHKNDKISQVDIDYSYEKEVDGNNASVYVTSKSMQSIYRWDNFGKECSIIDNPKTYITCLNDPNLKKVLEKDDNKFTIFITPVNYTCGLERCNNCNNKKNEKDELSIISPPRKTNAETSILPTILKPVVDIIESRTTSTITNFILKNISNNENMTKSHVPLMEEETVNLNVCVKSSNDSEKSIATMTRTHKLNHLPIISVDKYTQTEWCDIMLEARRNDDGHYSFHLPSLKVLKSYNHI